jgi:hypothetical protein
LTEDEINERDVSVSIMLDAWDDFIKAEEKPLIAKAEKMKKLIMPLLRESAINLFNE